MLKFFTGWSVWAYAGLFAAVLASVGAFAYHRGAISQAEEVGRLTGKIGALVTENTRLNADVAEADARTVTCQTKIKAQNDAIALMKEEADTRIREAAKAAAAARAVAQTYKDRAKRLSQQMPSKSCDEAAEKFRQQLEGERK